MAVIRAAVMSLALGMILGGPSITPALAVSSDSYVATNGNDSNPGTQSAPWRTIAHAAAAVGAGSTVHVQPGTYREGAITVSQSGTAGSPITLVSDAPGGAVVADSSWHAFNITGSYVTVQGFEVYMTDPAHASAIIETHGAHESILNNYVHDADNVPGAPCLGGGGIDVYHNDYITVTGNRVAHIGIPSACNGMNGIYIGGSNQYIANNIVSDVTGNCIQLWPYINSSQILNNSVDHCGSPAQSTQAGIVVGGDGRSGVTDNNVIANNVVRNVTGYSIRECCTDYAPNPVGPHEQYINNDVTGSTRGDFHLFSGAQPQKTQSGTPVGASSGPVASSSVAAGLPSSHGTTGPPTTTIASVPGDMIQNGSFDQTGPTWLHPWAFQTDGRAAVVQTASADWGHSATVSVPAAHTCDCAVQLEQSNLKLVGGASYKITFWAQATQARTIRPAVLHAVSPWPSYYTKPVSLTTSWQQITFSFTAPRSDTNAAFLFNLANEPGTVSIDNVDMVRS